ncbi:hypothetical protein GQ53DRAFT_867149, partial [Thozetella sp. PMI_491]
LIFPWAEGGNLRDTWRDLGRARTNRNELPLWALLELCRLSGAVYQLHEQGDRHGNINPENIFCFQEEQRLGQLMISNLYLTNSTDLSRGRDHHEV